MGTGQAGIKYSQTVALSLSASRGAAAFLGIACAATLAVLACLQGHDHARLALGAGVFAATVDAVRTAVFHLGDRGVGFLVLDRDKTVEVHSPTGRIRRGRLRDGSFVAPWLTIVRWRPEGAWFDRSIPIVPGMVDERSFRHLRVLLINS